MRTSTAQQAYSRRSAEYIALFDRVEPDDPDAALIRRHLTGLAGPVLDLGCGPGQWTAFLHAHGADVTGIDVVPEFIAHARTAHPGPAFRLASLRESGAADHSVAGVLAWYSLIHLPPTELPVVLLELRRLLAPEGVLVVGFFDSDDGIAAFDHAVASAYRWPVDALVERLSQAGFREVHRLRQQSADRPDRMYAAVVVRA